jgi:outer membrane receptor protein involved in Fe transport
MNTIKQLSLRLIIALIFSLESSYLFAQALEEIIVTAQRRVQSLQEVPISINVVSGNELRRQGFSNLEDFATFSPSVTMEDEADSTVTTIRGFGTFGNSMTLQSAAPMFLDGMHFGRVTMIRTAFMDTERMEVLKGPQPLYFGMNATAGAFNIISKRPTQEWEGNTTFVLGNHGTYEFEGGVGGPISDTLSIRVAGIYDHSAGPIKNGISDKRSPLYDNLGGRISMQWTPTEQLSIFSKVEGSRHKVGGDIQMGCLTAGRLAGYNRNNVLQGAASSPGIDPDRTIGNDKSVFAPPPKGIGMNSDAVVPEQKSGEDCFRGDYGQTRTKPYLDPGSFPKLFEERSSGNVGPGFIDIREAAQAFYTMEAASGPSLAGGFDVGGIDWKDDTNSINAMISIDYELNNGMALNVEAGYASYYREALEDNSNSFFFGNPLVRNEDYDQWSTQLRLTSRPEGYEIADGITLGFMAGVFHQEASMGGVSNGGRANLRRGQRLNHYGDDADWTNLFWNLDFKVLDDQLTLSVGGRYSTDDHRTTITGEAAQWIFNEAPCDYDIVANPTQDDNPLTCPVDTTFERVDPNLTTVTYSARSIGRPRDLVRIDSPLILVDNVDPAELWTIGRWQSERGVPLNWRKPEVNAVGLTAPVRGVRYEREGGPYDVDHGDKNYDTQVVLSYTPSALDTNHTFYAKYVSAFKGPISDTGFATIPDSIDTMTFDSEFVTSYEAGIKGSLFDRRVRYDISGFMTEFRDLQTSGAAPLFNPTEQATVSLNAGRQDVDGVEFSFQAAVTDRLSFNVAGAIMNGTMVDFDGGGCSSSETIAAAVDAINNPGGRSAAEITRANSIIATLDETGRGAPALARTVPDIYLLNGGCRLVDETLADGSIAGQGTFNRSGDRASRTPDYKIVMGTDYIYPLGSNYELSLNIHGYISDEVLLGENLSRIVMFPVHGDMNISGGIGSQDGTWDLSLHARSILAATAIYRPEFNFVNDGYVSYAGTRTNFSSYGVSFSYNFR